MKKPVLKHDTRVKKTEMAASILYILETLAEESLKAKVSCLMGKIGKNWLQCRSQELTMPVALWTWMMERYVK
jgi:hypothetical protein